MEEPRKTDKIYLFLSLSIFLPAINSPVPRLREVIKSNELIHVAVS